MIVKLKVSYYLLVQIKGNQYFWNYLAIPIIITDGQPDEKKILVSKTEHVIILTKF